MDKLLKEKKELEDKLKNLVNNEDLKDLHLALQIINSQIKAMSDE
jgi:hypothetical protein